MADLGLAYDVSNWSGVFTARPDDGVRERRALSAARPKTAALVRPLTADDARPFTATQADQMLAAGYDLGVFGTQDFAICRAQMDAARAAQHRLANYVYLLFQRDPIAQVEQALRVMDGYASEWLALDCEDPNAEYLTEGACVEFIGRAAERAKTDRGVKVYSAPYWWIRQTGNSTEFSRAGYDLWNATARGRPGIDSVNYGGWLEPFMDQWHFDQSLAGVNVDLNSYRKAAAPPAPGPDLGRFRIVPMGEPVVDWTDAVDQRTITQRVRIVHDN